MNENDRIEGSFRDPVHQLNGHWYFWNEVWADQLGPYETEAEARRELDRYVREVLGE